MLSEIVRDSLAAQPDMEIVEGVDDIRRSFQANDCVDVAIIGASEPNDSSLALELLQLSPSTRVLTIATNGRRATLWELRPYRVPLGEVSPESLIRAIRTPAARGDDVLNVGSPRNHS
jgi:DNA-binding NarL/FixJ family response regulator